MGELKLEAFRKSLKEGQPERCYILYGQERYLREYYARELRHAVLGSDDDPFNLRQYEGKNLDLNELSEAVDAYPSFAERTMIEVRDYDLFQGTEEERKQLISILRELPEYCCLVFLFDTVEYKADKRKKNLCEAIRSCAATVEFPVQGQGELTRWVIRRFAAQKKEISREDASYLIFLCGSLMEGLINEIGKIAVYAKGSTITRQEIDAAAVPVIEAQTFKLTDALASKRYDEAADLMHKLFQLNTEPIAINAMIGSQLRRLYTANLTKQAGMGLSELMEILGSSEYACRQYLRICSGFTSSWYQDALRRCTEADLRLKTGTGDPNSILISLFLQLAWEQKT